MLRDSPENSLGRLPYFLLVTAPSRSLKILSSNSIGSSVHSTAAAAAGRLPGAAFASAESSSPFASSVAPSAAVGTSPLRKVDIAFQLHKVSSSVRELCLLRAVCRWSDCRRETDCFFGAECIQGGAVGREQGFVEYGLAFP